MMSSNELRFSQAPTVQAPRSKFLMDQNIRTTLNAGLLIPLSIDTDIMPGDTLDINGTIVCRQTTSIHPTMDNAFIEIFGIFVPHRLVWDHWKEFWGENTTGDWVQTTTYQIPQIIIAKAGSPNSKGVAKGDILQYMGIPILNQTTNGISINALAYRAYVLTWNDLFRDENVAAPMALYKGDSDCTIDTGTTNMQWGTYDVNNQLVLNPKPAPVYKYKDYFNACLPAPQKGNPITLPIGSYAPVIGNGTSLGLTDGTYNAAIMVAGDNYRISTQQNLYGTPTGSAFTSSTDLPPNKSLGLTNDSSKSGIIADLSNAVAATINAQRFAFAAQRILEASARTGSRYWEILEGIFNVNNPSAARLQRPELLFHRRLPINMEQVPQTSSTDNTSAQGNVAAFSLTSDSTHYTTHSFTEHGTLLILACVRQEHSYDTGINRMWSRKNKLDWYHPQMAFLGEQAILNKEIYATGTSTDDQVFGYNERWAELRYKPNINTGAFSTKYAQTLASWHYGDSYNSLPVLSHDWRKETAQFIDRTLAVQSNLEDQFLIDSRWHYEAVRCIPMYSVPSLIDHF